MIHTSDCGSIAHVIDSEKILQLSWGYIQSDDRFIARLKVLFINHKGSLAQLTQVVSDENINIVNLKIINRSQDFWELTLDVEVPSVERLEKLQGVLRNLSVINDVERV